MAPSKAKAPGTFGKQTGENSPLNLKRSAPFLHHTPSTRDYSPLLCILMQLQNVLSLGVKNGLDSAKTLDPPKISQHWKVIKTLNNQSTHQKADLLTNIISSSGRDAATNKETASLLAKHYENKSKLTFNANDRKLLRIYRKTIQDSKRYNHKNIFTIPFLMEELEAAIAKMNPGKAPGTDVIFGRMVQHFGNLAKKELLEIFNLSWATGKLPQIWKLSTVIPILKPNKNASECKNYRPISLTSTLCKLMERVIRRRLMNWLIENKKLHFYQQLSEPIIVLPTNSFT
ncbi:reverse transcriptase domain-containing protein [Trichonephila clavipes]|nr:reverse transcriptase domain-containing protein [Trichonephila clavipes]